MQVLRSLVFNLVLWTSATIYAPIVLLGFWLPPIPRFRFIALWARFNLWALKRLCGLGFVVEGMEHVPNEPMVILCKHQSSWETLATQVIFPPQVWVLKRDLLWLPFFGWGLALTQPIAIDRSAKRKAIEQVVEQGAQRLRTGRCVIVFPEGTRMPPGHQGRFKIGGAVLASRTGAPVLPVAHDAGWYWPRRRLIKSPGIIRVVIGPVIDSRGRSAEEINRLAEEWMRATMARLETRHTGNVAAEPEHC